MRSALLVASSPATVPSSSVNSLSPDGVPEFVKPAAIVGSMASDDRVDLAVVIVILLDPTESAEFGECGGNRDHDEDDDETGGEASA